MNNEWFNYNRCVSSHSVRKSIHHVLAIVLILHLHEIQSKQNKHRPLIAIKRNFNDSNDDFGLFSSFSQKHKAIKNYSVKIFISITNLNLNLAPCP